MDGRIDQTGVWCIKDIKKPNRDLQITYWPMFTAVWPLLAMGWSAPAGAMAWHWSDTSGDVKKKRSDIRNVIFFSPGGTTLVPLGSTIQDGRTMGALNMLGVLYLPTAN